MFSFVAADSSVRGVEMAIPTRGSLTPDEDKPEGVGEGPIGGDKAEDGWWLWLWLWWSRLKMGGGSAAIRMAFISVFCGVISDSFFSSVGEIVALLLLQQGAAVDLTALNADLLHESLRE